MVDVLPTNIILQGQFKTHLQFNAFLYNFTFFVLKVYTKPNSIINRCIRSVLFDFLFKFICNTREHEKFLWKNIYESNIKIWQQMIRRQKEDRNCDFGIQVKVVDALHHIFQKKVFLHHTKVNLKQFKLRYIYTSKHSIQ